MFPSKFRALTSDESEESDTSEDVPTVTREALEQKAISQYQEALSLEKTGKWETSEKILKRLLSSDVLTQVQCKAGGMSQSSMGHLKYCVTMNIGHCLVKQGKLEEGLIFYVKATKLDDTDLNLWYRIGLVGMKVTDLNLAVSAFEEGLQCSPNHWPSIDNIITVSYALGNYLTCLYFISKGLQMDPGYIKGHAFKAKVFQHSSSLLTEFPLYYPDCPLPEKPDEISLDTDLVRSFYIEAEDLAEREKKRWKPSLPKPLVPLRPEQPIKLDSWIQLAKCLLYMINLTEEQHPGEPIFRPVLFSCESGRESPVEVQDCNSDEEMSYECLGKSQDSDGDDQGGKGRSTVLERWMFSQKRRSARVRSTVRREEPSLARSLAQLIPPNLLPREDKRAEGAHWTDDSMQTMDLYRLFENKDSNEEVKTGQNMITNEERNRRIKDECYFNTESEKNDVVDFIKTSEEKKLGIVDLLKKLTAELAKKWDLLWPENLAKYYIKIFMIIIDYYPPTMRCGNDPPSFEEDLSILIFGELLLDYWILKGKSKGLPSPLGETALGGDFPSLYLGQLNTFAANTDNASLILRVFWLEALLFLHNGETEAAALALQQILIDENCGTTEVKLPNLIHNSVVNCSFASDLLKALRRNKNLAEVWELHSTGSFEDVTEILAESLRGENDNSDTAEIVISRPMQFALILDSYWHLANYKECLRWSEIWLFESLSHYRNSSDEERPQFATMIVNTLQGIVSCVDTVGCIIFDCLTPEKRTRLIQTLSSIICHQMEAPENSPEMPIESVAPWILLHHIIKYDEEMKMKKAGKTCHELEDEDEIPPSLKMLFQGHEYLGRRSWCCFNEGALLFHTLNTVYPVMQKLSQESESLTTISQQVDQIFYCLYGQQKKNKGRHIIDHNVLGLAMTWNRAQQVFIFTKPRSLPSYDSSGRCCISSDTEYLYAKLIKLVPDECNPNRLLDEMTKYIEGQINDVPRNSSPLPAEVEDIYYLLAHFYFRNKSWVTNKSSKALKYYLLDVCANPNRVDSWACLALARGSQIETRLNSCDTIKSECELLNNASMVCRCYERSLLLDPSQSTLWIERGTFSYTIHSFCSNLLKKEQNLSLEMFDTLERQKEAMINAAYECFTNANKLWYSCSGKDIQDERWLHHYMLGKIAEKKEEDPQIFVEHYTKASELLHEIGATYPFHICYSAPQPLAVETLELYYRVHACILKSLEDNEDKPLPGQTIKVFKEAINRFGKSSFVTKVSDCVRYDKPKKHRKVFSSDEEAMSVGLDIKEMMQDLLVKVEDGCVGGVQQLGAVKRKLSDANLTSAENAVEPATKVIRYEDNTSSHKTSSGDEVSIKSASRKEGTTTSKPAPVAKRNSSSSSGNKKTSDSSSDTSSTTDSSSTSSSSTSSSDSDSSSSDSGQDSDDSNEEPAAKKTKLSQEREPTDWKKEYELLATQCLKAMSLCKERFPEHYKSLYHLAHFYFKSKRHKDNAKVHELLLGPGGLFSDRKPNNFFNGIWRIPNSEIDRPGSFAAHMGRCVHLMLDFLRETKDHKMLLDLALQLKCVPEADKKYLRDNEREELCREAVTLCAQSLRKKFQECPMENSKKFLMDVYSVYRRAIKRNLKEPTFGNILSDIYCKLLGLKGDVGSTLEAAVKYCQQELNAQKQSAAISAVPTTLVATTTVCTTTSTTTPTITTPPIGTQQLSSSVTITSVPMVSPAPLTPVQPLTPTQPAAPVHHPLASKVPSLPSIPEIVPTPLSELKSPSSAPLSCSSTTSRRGSRGGTPFRKQRGRPPLSSSNPRMPSPRTFADLPRQNFPAFTDPRFSAQMAMVYQNELLRQNKLNLSDKDIIQVLKNNPNIMVQAQEMVKQLTNIGKPQPPSPEVIPSVSGASLIKDRPNLSITPIKPHPPSPTAKSPTATPISVSVQKLCNKLQSKQQESKKLGSTLTQNVTPPRVLPIQTSPTVIEATPRKLPPPAPAHLTIQKPGVTPPHSTYPERKSSPIVSPKQGLEIRHLPPSPIVSKPPEPSLQHKLLSKKMLASSGTSSKPKPQPAVPKHPLTATAGSIAEISRSLGESPSFPGSILKPVSKKPSPAHASSVPAPTKLSALRMLKRKETVDPLSVVPNRSLPPAPPLPPPHPDDKYKFLKSVPNLDSSVAETIRNFGTSITITPTNAKGTKTLPETKTQPPNKPKDPKLDPCEVIILDD